MSLEIFIGETLAAVERKFILATLYACKGNKTETAASLGIARSALYKKLARFQKESS